MAVQQQRLTPLTSENPRRLLLQQLAGHDHALDLVGALVDLGDPGSALPGRCRALGLAGSAGRKPPLSDTGTAARTAQVTALSDLLPAPVPSARSIAGTRQVSQRSVENGPGARLAESRFIRSGFAAFCGGRVGRVDVGAAGRRSDAINTRRRATRPCHGIHGDARTSGAARRLSADSVGHTRARPAAASDLRETWRPVH